MARRSFALCFGLTAVVLSCSSSDRGESALPAVFQGERAWDFEHVPSDTIPDGWLVQATNPGQHSAAWRVVADPDDAGKVLALTDTRGATGQTYNLCWTDELAFLDGVVEVAVRAGSGVEDQGGRPRVAHPRCRQLLPRPLEPAREQLPRLLRPRRTTRPARQRRAGRRSERVALDHDRARRGAHPLPLRRQALPHRQRRHAPLARWRGPVDQGGRSDELRRPPRLGPLKRASPHPSRACAPSRPKRPAWQASRPLAALCEPRRPRRPVKGRLSPTRPELSRAATQSRDGCGLAAVGASSRGQGELLQPLLELLGQLDLVGLA